MIGRLWADGSPLPLGLAIATMFPLLVVGTAMSACVGFDLSPKGSNDAAVSTDDAASDAGQKTVGANCGQDPSTGVTLCLAISACPSVAVDADRFPGCGFRVLPSGGFDLVCLCDTSLCPMGLSSTCTEASAVLTDANVISVCNQVGEGRCSAVKKSGSGASTCDKACASDCAGNQSCLSLCGC